MIVSGAKQVNSRTRTFQHSQLLVPQAGQVQTVPENIGLEPHVSLRHGAPTLLLRDTRYRYSLNKCDAWVTVAPARIAAATMAASVSIVSFAPACRAAFTCNSMQ